jgi:predicted secreted hydrolase
MFKSSLLREMASSKERFCHVLPFRQDSHSLSLADRRLVDSCHRDCFTICSTGYQGNAQPLPPVRFPQDEAAHRDLNEWWYYTGHINTVTPDGRAHHYGFELVFFQALRSDLPPSYAAHFAISDVTRGEFHFDQRRLIELGAVSILGQSAGQVVQGEGYVELTGYSC